jgi:uncharacterized protein (TIGR03435 family)
MKSHHNCRTYMAASSIVVGLTITLTTQGASQHVPTGPCPFDFDLACVAPNTGGEQSVETTSNGVWELKGVTLRDLVRIAYSAEGIHADNQIEGGQPWMRDRYDVRSRIPRTSAEPTIHDRLKTLLQEEFGLRGRIQEQYRPVFDLVQVDAGRPLGPRITPSVCVNGRPPSSTVVGHRERLASCAVFRVAAAGVAENVTMAGLATALSALPEVGRPVRDLTGLREPYHLQVVWSGRALVGPSAYLTLSQPGGLLRDLQFALSTQLGLTLNEGRDRVPVLLLEDAGLHDHHHH